MLKMMKNEMRINNLQRKKLEEAKEKRNRMMLGLRPSTAFRQNHKRQKSK